MIISTHFLFILVKVVSKRIDCAFSTSYNDTSEEASKTILFKLHITCSPSAAEPNSEILG